MLRIRLGSLCSLILLPVLASSACSHIADDCETTSTCPSAAGNAGSTKGGSSGTAGSKAGGSAGTANAGEGGSAIGGSSSAGNGGSTSPVAGDAGTGGIGGVANVPCDGACTAPNPICDVPSDTCVECLEEGDCAAGAKKKCDTTAKACVECLAATDCGDAKTAKCDGGACVKCTSNDDCAHVAGKTVCDTAAGECVECTGTDYASCGLSMGTPLVCDSLKRTCSNKKEHSAGLCQVCLNDQQCNAGQLCVKETFGDPAKDVGYFCFATQAAASGADCTLSTNQPFTKLFAKQTSVDGTTADVCGLSKSTCVASNQFGAQSCATSMAADDSKCGFAPGKDSKCVALGPSQFRCTMTCGFDDDCPGTSCDTGVAPRVCKLQ